MENRPAGEPVLSRHEGWPPVEVQPLETWHKCTRCGEEVEIKFPTLAADWVATAEGFAEAHRNCRRP